MNPTPRTIHLSASAITSFKACPTRFNYGYIEGIRPIEDSESQRVGTNWHSLHEVYRDAEMAADPDITPFDAAIGHLNATYATVPDGFDAYAWEIERTILAMSFAGYVWYHQGDVVETLATEVSFKLPLHHPKTRMPLPVNEVVRVGKIDRVVRYNGRISIADYKSTSKPIHADSDFWNHLRLDSQISMYVAAAQDLQKSGALAEYGIGSDEEVAGAFYDVWHKPTIKPSMLTQADTKALIEGGGYLGAAFKVEVSDTTDDAGVRQVRVTVDGAETEVEVGKKGFAIRETPGMFGARLLADIYQRPDFYFARREIPRTDRDLRWFREQMYSIYQSMKTARDTGHWVANEHQCNATFRCPYTSICWNGVDVSGGQTPDGFKRIFTDLTVGGEQVEI